MAEQIRQLFDREEAEKVFSEVLRTPQVFKIDFRYKADIDSVPTAKYTIERYVFDNAGKKVNE